VTGAAGPSRWASPEWAPESGPWPAHRTSSQPRVAAAGQRVNAALAPEAWSPPPGANSIAAHPAGMLRTDYTTSRTALEALTLNLAAELADTGDHRERVPTRRRGHRHTGLDPLPGPRRVGAALHQRLMESHQRGTSLTPE
jgi:hypothetical protein